jgi:glucose-6-phosphate-specific signal transduction histidine kinase
VPPLTTPTPNPSPQGGGEKNSGGAWLELTVRDDGFGIPVGQTQGFGLRGMQERVQALGGDFTIETGSGRGTSVRIVIPLPSPSNGATQSIDHAGNTS